MKEFYKNLKIYTEQGRLIFSLQNHKKILKLPLYIFKAFFLNTVKKKALNIYKGNFLIISRSKKLTINLYNGKNFKIFRFDNLSLTKKYGQFYTTRILNSGKMLHLKKKQLRK